MIHEARAKGFEVSERGTVPDPLLYSNGYLQKPTLVFKPDQPLSVVKDEQFGLVLPIMKFTTDEEAVRLANNTEYGLCSSVSTADKGRPFTCHDNWTQATPT